MIVLRIQHWFPDDRPVVDHTVVEVKKQNDRLDASLEQLENALESLNWIWTLLGTADLGRRLFFLRISSAPIR